MAQSQKVFSRCPRYSPNQFLGWDFLAASYSKTALANRLWALPPPSYQDDIVYGRPLRYLRKNGLFVSTETNSQKDINMYGKSIVKMPPSIFYA